MMNETKQSIVSLIVRAGVCLAFAGILIIPLFVAAVFEGMYTLPLRFAVPALLICLTVVLFLMKKMNIAFMLTLMGVVALLWGTIALVGLTSYREMQKKMQYISPPDSKSQIYAEKNVMVLIPHQDDEINLMGGIIEEYVKYSSDLTVVFSTNGDYYGNGDIRLQEAVAALSHLGLSEKDIVFLGYGNEWQNGHIYNSPEQQIKSSAAGYTKTYGSEKFPPYRDGRDYTKENFLNDIKAVILEKRPELIYCVDYDYNKDHRALSLSFEKVLGEILREQSDYKPVVLKGFAYSTAWYAPQDYEDSLNIYSTKNPYDSEYMQENNIYLWKNRLQLPVSADSLSRIPEMSRLYHAIAKHRSQNAVDNAKGIINADKVFWERETKSILYDAHISVSSGDATRLNDFMLTDCRAIESDLMPFDGTWMPDATDREKSLSISLPEPMDIKRIKLYDKPSLDENILNVKILFDDGTVIESGPLLPNGSATELVVDKYAVGKIEMYIEESEGNAPGLSEIEAYSQEREENFPYIKLTDEEGNFLYDCVSMDEKITLYLHSSPDVKMDGSEISIVSDNDKVRHEIKDGYLELNLPKGEKAVIGVRHEESGLEDYIIVRDAETLSSPFSKIAKHIYSKHMNLNKRQQEYYGMIINNSLPGGLLQVIKVDG